VLFRSKQATRGLALLRRLRAITSLDESPRLKRIMAELESPEPAPCRRSLTEELKRAPVCDCGFVVGDKIPEAQQSDFAALIEQALCDYRTLLRTPEVGDALMARAYAVRDIDPDASTRLRSLHATLAREDTESVTALMDLLDESTMAECRTALAHATPVHARSLADLSEKLQGRRLTRRHIIEAVDEWIGSGGEQSVIAIEQASPRDQQASPSAVWWSLLHQDLDLSQLPGAAMDADSLRAFETACERSYPSSSLAPLLERSASRQVLTFVTGEPVHTLAVQAAWRTLAARVISHSPGLPEIAPSSAHLHAETAHLVADHLRCLRNLQASLASGAPRRLLARIELSRICADPWGCAELTRLAETAMRESAEACDDWLASLPPRDALEPDTRPIVLVYDAVPVDVWVRALDSVTADGYRLTWQRLDTVPHTVPSLRALLGIPEDCDPIEGAEALGMHYHTIDGSEEKPLLDLVPLSDAGTGILVRIAVFDRTAHAGGLRLENMAERFTTLLDRHIRALRTACSDAGRPLLLTTDHGLSYQHGKLTHGTEGVYERALPLVQLDRPAE